MVVAACGGKDDGSVTVGDYSLTLPPGWVKTGEDRVVKAISLRRDAKDPRDVMTAEVAAGTGGDTSDDQACRAGAAAMARDDLTIRSVAALSLPIGKACRITFFGVKPANSAKPVVSEELLIAGEHGLFIQCNHADGGGSVADCESLFASIRRR